MNPHLELVPGFGTFTTRSLTRGNSQRLGRHSHRSFDLEALVFGALDQIGADLFQTLHVSGYGGEERWRVQRRHGAVNT